MTKAQALHDFFNSFGIDGYVNSSVPDKPVFPYLTYEYKTAEFGDEPVSITVNLYYYGESEALPNAKAEEISRTIGRGGTDLHCDDGIIWVKKGSPFCQTIVDESNNLIKRRYINITLEYLTEN